MARLDDYDARRYDAVVGAVVPAVERALSAGVFANRAHPTPTGLALAPWPAARLRYRRAIDAATTGRWRAAFVGDVARCYPSIEAATVRRALARLGVPEPERRRIEDVLAEFHARGVPGLPVGPVASAVLANAVLATVDRRLAEVAGSVAMWWVDDVVVFARDGAQARHVRSSFDRSLERLGLHAHPSKCSVVTDLDGVRSSSSRTSALGCSTVA